jgi:hypothetical protein
MRSLLLPIGHRRNASKIHPQGLFVPTDSAEDPKKERPQPCHRSRPETDGTNHHQGNHPVDRSIACHDWCPLSSPAFGKARPPCQKSRYAREYVEVQDAVSSFISAAPVIAVSAITTMSVVVRHGWRSAAKQTANTRRALKRSSIMPIASELIASAS